MKKYFHILVVLVIILASCKGKSDKQAPIDDSTTVQSRYAWEAQLNDSTGRLEMIKKEGMGPDSINAAAVINFVNAKYPNVQLVFSGLSGDTMFLKIPEAMYLTQQMGSTGPTLYFADAVYNLTEIPGVKYVRFDFEEGDHASPETLGRESFNNEYDRKSESPEVGKKLSVYLSCLSDFRTFGLPDFLITLGISPPYSQSASPSANRRRSLSNHRPSCLHIR